MSAISTIEWTDATWNPVAGCDARVRPDRLGFPLRWRKPRRVFVMCDLFHEAVPDEFIDEVFAVMAMAQQHTFHVLTRRPERMLRWFGTTDNREEEVGRIVRERTGGEHSGLLDWPLPNVWIGVSVEDQQRANERIPLLLQTPAAARFISAEPLLWFIDFNTIQAGDQRIDALSGFVSYTGSHAGWLRHCRKFYPYVDWVIVGGESGAGARPCELIWIRSIVDQCRVACVPVFVKQLGAHPIVYHDEAKRILASGGRVEWDDSGEQISARLLLRDRKGADTTEWPQDLRVREMPERLP